MGKARCGKRRPVRQEVGGKADYSVERITMTRACNVVVLVLLLCLADGSVKSQVPPIWSVPYNGPGNRADNAYAMSLDAAGNIYVAGEATTGAGSSDSIDCAIVKYNAIGDTLWVRFYNGTGNRRDVVRALTVDHDGNVYATGESYGTGNYDIATVKYSPTGERGWAARYNGPANGTDGGEAIAVDSSGNVYVTGYSDGEASPVLRQDDFVTIKYDSAGVLQWAKRYDGPSSFHDIPHAIAVNPAGEVYVTGESSGSGTRYDYATIKYSTAGDTLWVRRYDGPAHYNDKALALAIDAAGNVFVTGSSDGSSSGTEDYLTIKYSSSGEEEWVQRYEGPGGSDNAFAITIDTAGNNVYVTGESTGPGPLYGFDYLTIRSRTSTGDTVWTARYDGEGKGFDAAVAIAADRSGNVYVTGYSTGSSSGLDIATLHYDSTGSQEWVGRYTSSGANNDVGAAIVWDPSGYVYVAGTANGGAEGTNFVTLKYSSLNPAVGVAQESRFTPKGYTLWQNYPNPFNPSTTIRYALPHTSGIEIRIYNTLGQEVRSLFEGVQEAGVHQVAFSGADLASGLYVLVLKAGEFVESRKLLLVR